MWCGRQTENQTDHLLYLSLVSFPVPNYCLLDLGWGVLRYGHVPLRGGQEDRPPCLPDCHRGRHVLGKKKRLNRYGGWSMEID